MELIADEVWKDILGYEGFYQISNMGLVKGLDRYAKHKEGGDQLIKGRILKYGYYPNGYPFVCLCKNGFARGIMVHRIVGLHFLDNPNGCQILNHLDGDKSNARASNLEWCTNSHNVRHAQASGLMNTNGTHNGYARAVTLEKDGVILTFGTQREAAQFIGTKEINISAAKSRKYLHKGYKIVDA